MPNLYEIFGYKIYIWTYESRPLEPVHVHICKGRPTKTATKIWITRNGKTIKCHNKSRVPEHELNKIRRFIEKNAMSIVESWVFTFRELRFYE